MDTKVALKLELEKQIKAKEINVINQKLNDLVVTVATDKFYQSDENLYSIHPRIYAKPTYQAREEEK